MALQTEYVFGTVCSVDLFEDGTDELYKDVFLRLNSIDDKFNINKPYSEISKINSSAGQKKVQISEECFSLLSFSKKMAELTDNSFNPVMGALTFLWKDASENKKVPDVKKIEEAKNHCNPDSLVLTNSKADDKIFYAELIDKDAKLDLGAIVKGYACDELVKLLSERKVKKAIINLGGNIYVYGKKSQSENWKVGIKNPIDNGSPVAKTVLLESGSVVTSGDYERFFEEDGKRFHHIIDGKTGMPSESGLSSVSVIYSKSIICDVLSTALFVAGKDADYVKRLNLDNVQVIFIDKSGQIIDKSK